MRRAGKLSLQQPAIFPFLKFPADKPMITHLTPAPADALPALLFQPLIPAEEGDEIDRAIATAAGRWPALQPSLEGAGRLVRADSVYDVPEGAPELSLVRSPDEWALHAVSPSPTGLACKCDGWPPTTPAGPGDGLYCADILACLLILYLQRPLSPLSIALEELWQATLQELRLQMTRATFDLWLLGSTVVPEASTPLFLTIAVRSKYAPEWLTRRLHHVIARTLTTVADYPVKFRFIAA